MPSLFYLILPIMLVSQSITFMVVRSSFRKRETIVLYGVYFLFSALLSIIFIYAIPYKIVALEYLRGYALFFTFFFIMFAWHSISLPAKKWLMYSIWTMIGGLAVGTFHSLYLASYTAEGRALLMENLSRNGLGGAPAGMKISIALMIVATAWDFNTTFFNFVNVFRIEEAKKQIQTGPSYSLKAIGDSCGFSSYTTFAKYYKMYLTKPADWYYNLTDY